MTPQNNWPTWHMSINKLLLWENKISYNISGAHFCHLSNKNGVFCIWPFYLVYNENTDSPTVNHQYLLLGLVECETRVRIKAVDYKSKKQYKLQSSVKATPSSKNANPISSHPPSVPSANMRSNHDFHFQHLLNATIVSFLFC